MSPTIKRIAGLVLTLTLVGCSTANFSNRLVDSVDLGRGPNGELCRADRVFDVESLSTLDGAYVLRCRGWTDTDTVGRFYGLNNAKASQAVLEADQKARLVCGEAKSFAPGSGIDGMMRRCISRTSGYRTVAVTMRRGETLYMGEAIDQFQGSLAAGLKAMAGVKQLPDVSALPELAMTDELAQISPAAGAPRQEINQATIESHRDEALGYNLRAQYSEARDVITRYYAQLPTATTPRERIDYLMELALAESNLGYNDLAEDYLDQAASLLDNTPDIRSNPREILNLKMPVYRAIVALNKRDFQGASIAAAQAISLNQKSAADNARQGSVETSPLTDPAIMRLVNSGAQVDTLGQTLDLAAVRANILRAQALYVHGAALQAMGSLPEAGADLEKAHEVLKEIASGGLDMSNLQWLVSAIAAESARVAERMGDKAAANRYFQIAIDALGRRSLYADSPLLAQRYLTYGGFLARERKDEEARGSYRAAMKILLNGGPSAAAGIAGLSDYLKLLARVIAAGGESADAAKADFFLAAQFVAPAAVAAQVAQIQKVFEAGAGPAAVRAKALQDLDREARTLDTQIAGLASDAVADRERLSRQQADVLTKAAQIRAELAADSQYQQATDAVVLLPDLQKALSAGEAYFRLVTLPGTSYGIVITARAITVYPIVMATRDVSALVAKVRKTIDGPRSFVFDVAAAQKIYDVLLGPASRLLAPSESLIVEPSGPLSQLPIGVLVEDKASADWFAQNVRKNSRDYTGVRFLARSKNISTTISPRAFLISRRQSASAASRPFVGFGNHKQPDASVLDRFPGKSTELGTRCGMNAGALRAAFGQLPSLGKTDLDIAERALRGDRLYESASFTDGKVIAMGRADALSGDNQLAQYQVIYFATHGLKEGELGCENPPALVTSIGDDATSDGLLSFKEIANLHLDANLVVLSACNTAAVATESQSRGAGFRSSAADAAATLNGLVRAFLVAGSRSVLTTHWAIPIEVAVKGYGTVEPSARLMERFFKNGATMPVAQALRDAQSAMIANIPTSNPYYWGAFALVGDGSRYMLGRGQLAEARAAVAAAATLHEPMP